MKNILKLLLPFILVTSCTHHYYIQDSHNVPLFKEKNQFSASLNRGGGSEIAKTDVQAAYSVSNNIAFMINYLNADGGTEDYNSNYGFGDYWDGAIGYYKPIYENYIFETYIGYGVGKQHHEYDEYYKSLNTSDLTFSKIFIQPNFGMTTKYFEAAISFRFCRLSFNEIKSVPFNTDDYDLNLIKSNKNSFLFEPAMTLRIGYKSVKIQFQYANTINLTKNDLKFDYNSFTLGLYFPLRKWD
jgi:hypothetical protein